MVRIKAIYILVFFFVVGTHGICEQSRYKIDWRAHEIVITATGDIVSREKGNTVEWQYSAVISAKQELLKSFIASMSSLRVDAYNFARDIIMGDPLRNEALNRYMRNLVDFKVIYEDKRVVLKKHVPFFGSEGVVNLLVKGGRDPGNFPSYDEFVFSADFTGVVIDGRGLGRLPAINPRIFDEEHNLVYSADLMETESFKQWGACAYTEGPYYKKELKQRVGENPYTIVAIPNDKLIETDLCISNEDAMVLLQQEETRKNLERGRVIIIIDGI